MGKVVEIPADMTARDLCQLLVYKSHCVDDNSWALVEHHPLVGLGKEATARGHNAPFAYAHTHTHSPAFFHTPALPCKSCTDIHRCICIYYTCMLAYPHILANKQPECIFTCKACVQARVHAHQVSYSGCRKKAAVAALCDPDVQKKNGIVRAREEHAAIRWMSGCKLTNNLKPRPRKI